MLLFPSGCISGPSLLRESDLMHIIPLIKTSFQNIPYPVGCLLAKIPYRMRPWIGHFYRENQSRILAFEKMNTEQKQNYIVDRMRKVITNSMKIPFYRKLYADHGVRPENIHDYSDIARLPIVSKEMLRNIPLEERSFRAPGRYVVNTGGSSGATLDFYITPAQIPVEWAHMHTIWAKYGYKQSALKIGFGGRNLGNKSIVYDGLRHQHTINVYTDFKCILPALRKVVAKGNVRYLHGYPSAMAEFAENCMRLAPDVVESLRYSLCGAFLGSEYPAESYRLKIESVFDIPTISWYGHTERAILAWEKQEKYVYYPFQTYGYCEVVPNPETGGWKLIGTSYGNSASPFIRYDTGDDVEPVEIRDGLLQSFRIRSGRIGEFVLDRQGVKIPLTALIFGRHHRLFDIAQFVQVQQTTSGEMTVIVTIKGDIPRGFVFSEWFDNTGLDMKIQFRAVDKPILSPSGKVTLKVL